MKEEKLLEQGLRLEQLVNKEGLSQADFSLKTGIKTSTLNHVIKGRNDISPMVMSQILRAFPHFSEEWIRTGNGEMTNSVMMNNYSLANSVAPVYQELPLFDLPKGSQASDTVESQIPNNAARIKEKRITKIIVYYDDNTFETFLHEK